MPAEVTTLYDSNYRDVSATLRKIADSVENGEYGVVGAAGLVVMGDAVHVFGLGPDSEGPTVALLLHAGFLRLSSALESHGAHE